MGKMKSLVPLKLHGAGADPREVIKKIAMDIGKQVVHHIETMYPAAIAATPSTFKLSVRNSIHNEIMAALDITDEIEIFHRLERRAKQRKKLKAIWKKNRGKQI